MRYLTLLVITSTLLMGCAQEAYYADREYGVASMDAVDSQIAYKDYVHADKAVEGMDGLHAERTMELYHASFGEGFTQESIDTSAIGVD